MNIVLIKLSPDDKKIKSSFEHLKTNLESLFYYIFKFYNGIFNSLESRKYLHITTEDSHLFITNQFLTLSIYFCHFMHATIVFSSRNLGSTCYLIGTFGLNCRAFRMRASESSQTKGFLW